MNRITVSLVAGALIGGVVLAAAFAGVSVAHPGWLREWLSPDASAQAANPNPRPTAPKGAKPGASATPRLSAATPLPTDAHAACGGPEQMTIALLGVDTRENGYDTPSRTDAISLINVRFTTKSAAVLSIPRDLYVPLPNLSDAGITQDRINTAYLYGEIYGVEGGGPAEFKAAVELNLGVRVHRYVMVDFNAFVKFVDALGGIDLEVPTAIYDPLYPAADDVHTITFELPAGLQHLDGATALKYARTRHQDDDYHRLQRQQAVLLAVRDKVANPQVLAQIPALLNSLAGSVRTDLTPQEIASLLCLGPQIDRSAIGAFAIDGSKVIPWRTPSGGDVSIPDRDAIAPLVQQFLGP